MNTSMDFPHGSGSDPCSPSTKNPVRIPPPLASPCSPSCPARRSFHSPSQNAPPTKLVSYRTNTPITHPPGKITPIPFKSHRYDNHNRHRFQFFAHFKAHTAIYFPFIYHNLYLILKSITEPYFDLKQQS